MFADCRRVIEADEPLGVVDFLARLAEFGFANHFFHAGLEFAGKAPRLPRHLAQGAQDDRQVLGTDANDRDDRDQEEFGPADIEHESRLAVVGRIFADVEGFDVFLFAGGIGFRQGIVAGTDAIGGDRRPGIEKSCGFEVLQAG